MRSLLWLAGALLLPAATCAEEPARPAPASAETPAATASGLREAPADKREPLRQRRLQVTLRLSSGTSVQGILESYRPGRDGHPGAFALVLEGEKTDIDVVYEEDVLRVEVGESVKDAKSVRPDLPPEVLEAIKADKAGQIIERRRAALKTTKDFELARADLGFLARIYRHQEAQGLVTKPAIERLRADVAAVEDEGVRVKLQNLLQDGRFIWGRPLKLGPRRGGNAPEKP
jgi:hypothetical protein